METSENRLCSSRYAMEDKCFTCPGKRKNQWKKKVVKEDVEIFNYE
jgi:hypothetical protein